jgi:hypothetical protein
MGDRARGLVDLVLVPHAPLVHVLAHVRFMPMSHTMTMKLGTFMLRMRLMFWTSRTMTLSLLMTSI